MTLKTFIIAALISMSVFSGCKKEISSPDVTSEIKDTEKITLRAHYIIYTGPGNGIDGYEFFEWDTLRYSITFTYHTDLIAAIYNEPGGLTRFDTVFLANGLVTKTKSAHYLGSSHYYRYVYYKYNTGGTLAEDSTVYITNSNDTSAEGWYRNVYNYENGNRTSWEYFQPFGPGSSEYFSFKDWYTYGDLIAEININDLWLAAIGMDSRNLLKHENYARKGNYSTGYNHAYSHYEYELDKGNFVNSTEETYYPAWNSGGQGPKPKVSFTTYEYVR